MERIDFKVGQRVRLTHTPIADTIHLIGRVGIIRIIGPDDLANVQFSKKEAILATPDMLAVDYGPN